MSNLDFITTEVSFHGNDVIKTLEENYLMYDGVWKLAKDQLNAHVKVHVSQREPDDGPIEWSVSVTSPTGRQTLSLSQRSSIGSVSINPG